MGEGSKIEWCDHSFNPWVGCTKVGPGCDHCYAESWAKRTGANVWGPGAQRRRTKTWGNPRKWNKTRHPSGRRWRVFCASLADVFDNEVPTEWRNDLWDLIRECDNLTWIIVTKRIGNAKRMLPADWGDGWPHVWLLSTVVNQDEADRDIPKLLATPAAVRGISAEPLLGPIDLTAIVGTGFPWHPPGPSGCYRLDALRGHEYHSQYGTWVGGTNAPAGLDWVIAGGESGGKSRPAHPGWFRAMLDQCFAAHVPFHFKQFGNWAPARRGAETHLMKVDGTLVTRDQATQTRKIDDHRSMSEDFIDRGHPGWARMRRVNKKLAGRTLDGETWDQYPE